MFLHLADDTIFLDYAIEQFEEIIPGQNIYLVNTDKPKYIKNIDKIICKSNKLDEYKKYIDELDKYNAVIIHALTSDKIKIVNSINKKIIFVWMFWGADGYYLNKIKQILYSQKTKKILNSLNESSIWFRLKQYFYSKDLFSIPYTLLTNKKLPEDFERRKAIRRMNYCVPVIEEDYYFIKKHLGFKAKLINYNYGNIEKLTSLCYLENEIKGSAIQVGNSGDPANNHIDILDLLKKKNVDCNIIVPMSYGKIDYINYVKEYGTKLFGEQFIPINNFLPLIEYNRILSDAKIVIMNHFVQQAMGNIFFALWCGKLIFISKRSPVFNFLSRNGVYFRTIERDLIKQHAFAPLNRNEIDSNRKFINEFYSKEVVLKKTKFLIQQISKN